MDILKINNFLNNNGYGYGDGDGYGNGSGYGSGDGYGYGNCYGNGNGNGSGNGYGDGIGYGYGDGSGNGNGNGYGNGYGNGSGNGYGDGSGNGIKRINGYSVYRIDSIPTILTHIHGNIAKGYILERNVVLKPCYIAKGNGYFAHGVTLQKAQAALKEKIINNMDIDEKIELFKQHFPNVNKKYPVSEFYQWHHNLTGSCEMGRKTFASNHGIDIENDMMTVKEFIELTENAYCGEIIRELKESY